jgi:hypothetical protein
VILTLDRFSYAKTETEGLLTVSDHVLATLERPWITAAYLGGKPFESCIPDGMYALEPYFRAKNNEAAYRLINHELGVYGSQDSMGGNPGRYDCLVHSANFVHQVVGCIAVGTNRQILRNNATGSYEGAVAGSQEAMRLLHSILDPLKDDVHMLVIRPKAGAVGVKRS